MKYKLKITQSIKRRTFANVRPYMPLKWLPVIAGYTRIRKTTGYAGGYLLLLAFIKSKIFSINGRYPPNQSF